jgi:hypothetical protein
MILPTETIPEDFLMTILRAMILSALVVGAAGLGLGSAKPVPPATTTCCGCECCAAGCPLCANGGCAACPMCEGCAACAACPQCAGTK